MERGYLFLTVCIVLGVIYIAHQYLLEKQRRVHYEHFQDERKEENLCLKPFSVGNNKESTFRALIALEERIDELEYKLRKSGQRYEPIYKWYKQKFEKDSAEAKQATEAVKKEFQASLDQQVEDAKAQYLKRQQEEALNAELGTLSTPDNKPAKEAIRKSFQKGTAEERIELISAVKKVDAPEGYW